MAGKKDKKSGIRPEDNAAIAPSRARRRASRSPSSRRTHEAIGILTLASSLLVGPSLASIQFGSGDVMGPFGELVGNGLHRALGLAGYAVVLWLALIAIRLFADALGERQSACTASVWRRPLGIGLAIFFGAMLFHLTGRPRQLAHASFGGAVGEYSVELLCAFVSVAGTWIIVVSGMALSLVLATNFSWVHAAIRLWDTGASVLKGSRSALLRAPERARAAARWVAHQLAYARTRQQMSSDAAGTATLPPVLRIDFGTRPDEPGSISLRAAADAHDDGRRSKSGSAGHAHVGPIAPAVQTRSVDARTGASPAERANDWIAALASAAATISTPGDGRSTSAASNADCGSTSAGEANEPCQPQTLTIVRSTFASRPDDEDDGQFGAPAPSESLSGANGSGFVLTCDTYRTPPLALLTLHGDAQQPIDEQAIQQQAARLTKTLADYKIIGKVTEVHPGPVVTMYEFVPAPGTRVSKVANLSNDLAMALHAERVRIVAPIPGKGAIGIEVPNGAREIVSFKEIVADKAFRAAGRASRLTLAIGKNIVGAPVVMDLAKMPHLLVAGATGAGKSVSINAMICSLLLRHPPEDLRLILIDPKFLELSGYDGIPHLLLPVVTDPKQAAVALRWAVAEMERRYQLLANQRVRDIGTYNRKVDKVHDRQADTNDDEHDRPILDSDALTEAAPAQVTRICKHADGSEQRLSEKIDECVSADEAAHDELHTQAEPTGATRKRRRSSRRKADPDLQRLPYLVVVIDEFADLMMIASKEVETCVARLAQKARACGIHLIVATQRPSVDVITGLIKANFPSRVAFQVASNHDSKTILGAYGAENLLGAGDMLVLDRGAEMKRVHGAYLSDEEILRVTDWLRDQGRPIYDEDILKGFDEPESGSDSNAAEPADALYDEAVALVSETRQASISMVQRRLRIGYNRAARLVEQMEREGIVGPPDGVRGREVLVQHHG